MCNFVIADLLIWFISISILLSGKFNLFKLLLSIIINSVILLI